MSRGEQHVQKVGFDGASSLTLDAPGRVSKPKPELLPFFVGARISERSKPEPKLANTSQD